MKRKDLVVIIPIENIKAVKRMLRMADRYMSTQQDKLLAYDGGMMTLRELRQQVRAAKRLLAVKTESARRR